MRRAHLPALEAHREAATVVAVCDPDPCRAAEVAGRLEGVRWYTDVADLLGGGGVELLVVASPPSAHLAAVLAALDRGVDVLCEKPLGISVADAHLLATRLATRPECLVASVHQYRFAEAWTAVVEASQPALARGSLRLEVEVARPGTDPVSTGGWRARGRSEGGILGDHAVHYLALCWRLAPATRVTAARCWGEPGREAADVEVLLGNGGAARVRTSYLGSTRHNRILAADVASGLTVEWCDGRLVTDGIGSGERRSVGALSDRAFVDRLYGDLYAELFTYLDDDGWRRLATAETVAVASLLARAVELAS